MSVSTSWISPGRVLRIRFEGTLTSDDFTALREPVQAALASSSSKLDYLLDTREATYFPESALRIMLDKRGILRSTKTGRMAVLGATPQQRLFLDSAALALRLPLGYFDDERDALAFIVS